MIAGYALDKPLRALHVPRAPGAEEAANSWRLLLYALLMNGILEVQVR